MHPNQLTNEKLRETLKPGTQAADDPTRIGDGNELGVYMSTNPTMVEQVYAHGGKLAGLSIPVARYKDRQGGMHMGIQLPSCGVVCEIDTTGLSIREPKMIQALEGHYNNGFQGHEWIADNIPPDHYKIRKLTLSDHPHDKRQIIIDVEHSTPEALDDAIERIQQEFKQREREARIFKEFMDSLSDHERFNSYIWEKKWQERK